MAPTVPDHAPMSLSSVTIYQASRISSGPVILLITHHYDGYLGVVPRDVRPWVPDIRCGAGTGRAGATGAGPARLPGEESSHQWSADTGAVQT